MLAMEQLHILGVSMIMDLQNYFRDYSDLMIFTTKLGDPKAAFLFYFPITYILQPSVGIKVAWVGAISELFNTVFKWLLHGERPYWWVHESGVYHKNHTPFLQQFPVTCETGPGSPSGHGMVTAAVLMIMLMALLKNEIVRRSQFRYLWSFMIWASYSCFMVGVCISRCFIATHFPHQVIAGVLAGALIGRACDRIIKPTWQLRMHLVAAVIILLVGFGMFWIVQELGLDPNWSVKLAMKRCHNSAWIHLDTTLFYSIIKDSSVLTGLGLGIYMYGNFSTTADQETPIPVVLKVISLMIILPLCQLSEYIRPPTSPEWLFYSASYVKFGAVIYFITLYNAMIFRYTDRGVETIRTTVKLD